MGILIALIVILGMFVAASYFYANLRAKEVDRRVSEIWNGTIANLCTHMNVHKMAICKHPVERLGYYWAINSFNNHGGVYCKDCGHVTVFGDPVAYEKRCAEIEVEKTEAVLIKAKEAHDKAKEKSGE